MREVACWTCLNEFGRRLAHHETREVTCWLAGLKLSWGPLSPTVWRKDAVRKFEIVLVPTLWREDAVRKFEIVLVTTLF
jgi:hypothetical protein